MANRVLRDWTDSEPINSLSVNSERFFTRLIMKVDDYGRFYSDARLLKANLFPLLLDSIREADVIRWMAECQKAGLIVIYEVSSKRYLQIVDFKQRLRKMTSKYPGPSIDSQAPPEKKPETKQETEIPPENKFFFIRDNCYSIEVSEWFKENFSVFLEQWVMKNKEPILKLVFDRMDTDYFAYSFTNENHIQNTFKSIWKQLKEIKSPETPTLKRNQPIK